MSGQWVSTLYVLGAVQGLFLAAVLGSQNSSPAGRRLLAGVMLTLSVDLGIAVYHIKGCDAILPHLIGLDHPLTLLYGPLFYLYVRGLQTKNGFRSIDLAHFVPFVVLLVAMVPFYA